MSKRNYFGFGAMKPGLKHCDVEWCCAQIQKPFKFCLEHRTKKIDPPKTKTAVKNPAHWSDKE